MSYQHKTTTLTESMRQYMLARSAQVTPDNPSQQGWSASKIRQYQWKPSDILFTYMSGIETDLIEYVNECIDTISTNAGEITKLWEEVGKKQDKLIAGKGILIVGNVISTTNEGMKPGNGLRLDGDILSVDFEKVQSKIKCGSFSTFEAEANQDVGDFFIVEDEEKPNEDTAKEVATFEAKAVSIPVAVSPPFAENAGKEEKTHSFVPTLGSTSDENNEDKSKNKTASLTFSGIVVEGTGGDTGSSTSTTPALTLRSSTSTTPALTLRSSTSTGAKSNSASLTIK